MLYKGVGYRILRNLELEGFLKSQWDTEGEGVPKRVYTITPIGKEYLKKWFYDIKEQKELLDVLIEKLQELFNEQ